MDLGSYQNELSFLPVLNNYRYENIFKLYSKDKKYFYNITRKIELNLSNLDPSQFLYYPVKQKMPWTMISFNIYSTIELWWLLCLVNNIKNPLFQPKVGTFIKALAPGLVVPVIENIQQQL